MQRRPCSPHLGWHPLRTPPVRADGWFSFLEKQRGEEGARPRGDPALRSHAGRALRGRGEEGSFGQGGSGGCPGPFLGHEGWKWKHQEQSRAVGSGKHAGWWHGGVWRGGGTGRDGRRAVAARAAGSSWGCSPDPAVVSSQGCSVRARAGVRTGLAAMGARGAPFVRLQHLRHPDLVTGAQRGSKSLAAAPGAPARGRG